MKLKVVFLFIFFAQTSASFFDEFRGAMSSVENSFGKLLSDVVTDVRETIGCTILAVKQVLALGGIIHESSDYDTRCRGLSSGKDTLMFQQKNQESIIPTQLDRSNLIEKPLSERVSEEIDKSVSRVHNTMFDLIDKNNALKNIVKAKTNIAHETDRLSQISALLRRELGNISKEAKEQISKLESNSNHPTLNGIWSDIKALHEIEQSHRNTPVATDIRHILNEIVSVLHGDEIQNETPLFQTEAAVEDESNDAFLEIESQFEKIEQEHKETNYLNDIEAPDNDGSDLAQEPNEYPLTFKGVAKKIMDETSRTFRFADGSPQQYERVDSTTTEIPIVTEKYVDYSEESPDYNSFFQFAPKDSLARNEAIQGAINLIEKSKQTDAIMNDYFKKADKVGTSVFESSDLLDFA